MLRVKRFIRRYWRASLRLAFLLLTLLMLILAVLWYLDPDGKKYEPAITIFGILTGLIGGFTLYDWLVDRKSSPSSLYAGGSAIAPNTVIRESALRVLSRTVEEGGLAGVKRLFAETETLRAIESTAHAFPFIPHVDQALERWCGSNRVAELLADIARGRVQHPDAALVESFISDGEFGRGISDPTKDAEHVLDTFYKHLFEEGLKGTNALLEQYLRAEDRHGELHGRFDRVDARFDEQATATAAAALAMPSVFLKAGDFFRRYLKRRRVFHHAWRTVGRADTVCALDEFVESADLEIAIMSGRGGIGKTKIIQAFARGFRRRHKDYEFRLAAEGIPITKDSFGELPDFPCVVIVDDAHRRDDLQLLLAGARQRAYRTKIVLVTRQSELPKINAEVGRINYDTTEVIKLPEIEDLALADLTKLAAQALGPEYAGFAKELARETKDSPLFTVLGGRLIAEKRIPPDMFLTSEEFVNEVLKHFGDVLFGQISVRLDSEVSRTLAKLLAALGQINIRDDSLLQAMANFVGMDKSELIAALGELEEGGVLARRGYAARLVPDFVAEFLLEKACVGANGEVTGYGNNVFDAFNSFGFTRVFTNLAELDWRLRQKLGTTTAVFEHPWRVKEEQFRSADHLRRKGILDDLQQIASIQPDRVLKLAEFAINNPAPENEEGTTSIYSITHDSVLGSIPGLLVRVAQQSEYLPHCCDLLWRLAEMGNDRSKKAAIKGLQDLARYVPHRRVEDLLAVLSSAEIWLGKPTAERVVPALDVIDQMLRKNDHVDYSRGAAIVSKVVSVLPERTRELRDRAIEIFRQCVYATDIKVALRGLQSLQRALDDPSPLFGQQITREERLQWLPEQLAILEIVEGIVSNRQDPFIFLGVVGTVGWEAIRAPAPEVQSRARTIIEQIPDTYEVRLVQALKDRYDLLRTRVEIERPSSSSLPDQQWQSRSEMCLALADEFVTRHPKPKDGIDNLNLWIHRIEESGWHAGLPTLRNTFLGAIADRHRSYAAAMCKALIEGPDSPLASRSSDLLSILRNKGHEPFINVSKRFLETGHLSLCYSVAESYATGTWVNNWHQDDVELIKALLIDDRIAVKKAAIRSLNPLFQVEPDLALEMAAGVDPAGDEELTVELVSLFDEHFGIPLEKLSDEQLRRIVDKLELVKEIENRSVIQNFLSYASKRIPLQVVGMLTNRVKRQATSEFFYRPIPYDGLDLNLEGLASDPAYPEVLKQIRDLGAMPESWKMSDLPKLFKIVSLDFNETSLAVIDEWINSGDREKMKGALLLMEDVHPPFSFDNVDFISRSLRKGMEYGDESYRTALQMFERGAISNERSRILGEQHSPSLITQRDRAASVLATLRAGTPEHNFYQSILEDAERELEEERISDEALQDY